jgi:hypothetical protein
MNYFSLFYPSKFPARSSKRIPIVKHHSHWSIRWVRFHAFLTCLHLKDALFTERPKIVHAAGIPDFSTNALNSSSACPILLDQKNKGFLALLINSAAFSMFKVGLDYNSNICAFFITELKFIKLRFSDIH